MKNLSRRRFIKLSSAAALTSATIAAVSCGDETDGDSSSSSDPVDPGNGDNIHEQSKFIPVMAEADVVVIGGGPAGLAAALAASKEGLDTILVERFGFYGGVITQATMGSITWYRYADTIDAGGICTEFETRAQELGASIDIFGVVAGTPLEKILEAMGYMDDGVSTYQILDTEMFKYVADTLLLESGVLPILHCLTVGAIMDGNTIKGVITESKSGRQAILAKRVIDATGDADIANFAGAPFRKDPKNKLMEVTTNFSCSNVDMIRFGAYTLAQRGKMSDWSSETCGKEDDMFSTHMFEPFEKAKAAGEIPEDWDIRAFPGGFTLEGEVLSLNAIHMTGIDPTDVWDMTWAEMEGRKRSIYAMEAMKKYTPGFEDAKLRNFSTTLGTRESRKIIGAYNIDEHDVRNQATFSDSIGICPEFLDGYGVLCLPTTGRYFQVPYGITLPQEVENLLVAGRCVAGDKISHSATRQMVCCMVTGQGAGAAAAVSVRDNVTCRNVNISRVQSALKGQGVRIS